MLARAEGLGLTDWYLAAGCLFQTVWNVLEGHDPERGIGDYDLIYHDGTDLSWEAEDVVIRRCAAAFADLGAEVEVRNQARVHLWYEDHFGVPYAPLTSSAAAVDTVRGPRLPGGGASDGRAVRGLRPRRVRGRVRVRAPPEPRGGASIGVRDQVGALGRAVAPPPGPAVAARRGRRRRPDVDGEAMGSV